MDEVLLQQGAIGVVALLALAAVKVMFARLSAEADGHKQRADRLEDELRKLNEAVRTEYVRIIDATRALADAVATVRKD